MIQDLHSHTYYSFCGKDTPEAVVEEAISGDIEMIGICDHNYGVACVRNIVSQKDTDEEICDYQGMLRRYFDHMSIIREKYKDKIIVMRGIEVRTMQNDMNFALPSNVDISFFDYCLIENIDKETAIANGDLFAFAKRCGTPIVGVAHTDLFSFIESIGQKPKDYFRKMAAENIFWEMNVSYDSIHNYREHSYMKDFFVDKEKQKIVRESGVRVSIGFDGHRIEDYQPKRIVDYCKRLSDMGIKKPYES